MLIDHEHMPDALLTQMLGSAQAQRLAFTKGGAALVDGAAAPGRLIWFLDPHVLRTLADASGITRKVSSTNDRSLLEETPS